MERSTRAYGSGVSACMGHFQNSPAEPRGQIAAPDIFIKSSSWSPTARHISGFRRFQLYAEHQCGSGRHLYSRFSTAPLSRRRILSTLRARTWPGGAQHMVFRIGPSQSQIDYILVPKPLARGESKQSKPLTDFPLGRWKKGGHCPVEAKIRPLRHWQLSSQPPPPPPYDKQALEEAVRYNHPKAQAMKEWVADQLSKITTSDMEEVNEVLIKASERYFPRAPKPSSPPLNAMHRATKRMWARLTALDADLAQATLSPADHEMLVQDLATWHKQAVTRPGRFHPRGRSIYAKW